MQQLPRRPGARLIPVLPRRRCHCACGRILRRSAIASARRSRVVFASVVVGSQTVCHDRAAVPSSFSRHSSRWSRRTWPPRESRDIRVAGKRHECPCDFLSDRPIATLLSPARGKNHQCCCFSHAPPSRDRAEIADLFRFCLEIARVLRRGVTVALTPCIHLQIHRTSQEK